MNSGPIEKSTVEPDRETQWLYTEQFQRYAEAVFLLRFWDLSGDPSFGLRSEEQGPRTTEAQCSFRPSGLVLEDLLTKQ